MDIKLPNGTRFYNYVDWEKRKYVEYDYKRKGILSKIMSKNIVNTKNQILKFIIKFYEESLIFALSYVDILKHFKNPHWKNR